MAAPVGGGTAASAVGVTSLTIAYSPTAGNCLVIGVLLKSSSGSVIVLRDNLGNTYTADLILGSSATFHINSVPAGVTGFTASGFSAQTLVMALQEYSGAAGALFLSSNSTSTISGTIPAANDYIVGFQIAGSALTITSGTQRQATGAVNGDNLVIADNTSGVPNTLLTLTESGGTGFVNWALYLVGGAGHARVTDDVDLVVYKPPAPNVRVTDDVDLVVYKPPAPNVRVTDDVDVVIYKPAPANVRTTDDVDLVIVTSNPQARETEDVDIIVQSGIPQAKDSQDVDIIVKTIEYGNRDSQEVDLVIQQSPDVPPVQGFQGTPCDTTGTLRRHTDWDASGNDNSGANQQTDVGLLCIDENDVLYIGAFNPPRIHRFDNQGNYLSYLGNFSSLGGAATFQSLAIMFDAEGNKWLVAYTGAVWGNTIQALCIVGNPGAGYVTNVVTTLYNGLFAGGNNGGVCVDTFNGAIYSVGHNFAGGSSDGHAHLTRLTISVVGGVYALVPVDHDMTTMYGWTSAPSILFCKTDNTLIIHAADSAGDHYFKLDANTLAIVNQISSAGYDFGSNMGTDDNFVGISGLVAFRRIDAVTMNVVWSAQVFDYAISATITVAEWYDAATQTLWIIDHGATGNTWVLDMTTFGCPDPSSARVQLIDPYNHTDTTKVGAGIAVAADGTFAVTSTLTSDGMLTWGFIDFWNAAPFPVQPWNSILT